MGISASGVVRKEYHGRWRGGKATVVVDTFAMVTLTVGGGLVAVELAPPRKPWAVSDKRRRRRANSTGVNEGQDDMLR